MQMAKSAKINSTTTQLYACLLFSAFICFLFCFSFFSSSFLFSLFFFLRSCLLLTVAKCKDFNNLCVATFSSIRFMHGTRMKPVRMQFSVQLQFLQPDGTSGLAVVER